VKKVKYWKEFNRRSELLIAPSNFDAIAGKVIVPYEPAITFLHRLLVVMLGSNSLTA